MTNSSIHSKQRWRRQFSAKQQGMNIIELMVVVALVGILSLIAVPNMRIMVENSQVRSTTNDLAGALAFARSEALVRNGVLLRARVVGGVTSFDNGWCIVAVTVPQLTCENGGDNIVRFYESSNVLTISTTPAGLAEIQFNGRGALVLAGGNPPEFTVRHNNCVAGDTAERARTIELSRTGRATVGREDCA